MCTTKRMEKYHNNQQSKIPLGAKTTEKTDMSPDSSRRKAPSGPFKNFAAAKSVPRRSRTTWNFPISWSWGSKITKGRVGLFLFVYSFPGFQYCTLSEGLLCLKIQSSFRCTNWQYHQSRVEWSNSRHCTINANHPPNSRVLQDHNACSHKV